MSAIGWIRVALRGSGIVALMILLIPFHYLYRVLRYGSPFPMLFLKGAARLVGARVKRHGVPLHRDVFFLANHVSWVDILALGGASGTAFVAKAEVRDSAVLGWLAGLNRTVFVSRENRIGVAEQINALRESLADNWSIAIFPEPTTTDGQSLLPFKTSMLRVLEPPPPGVMVQPVLLDYGAIAEWIGWVGDETGIANAKRILSRRGSFELAIHFLEPFDPRDFSGRKAIAAEARARIEPALVAALGKPLRVFKHDVGSVGYVATANTNLQ